MNKLGMNELAGCGISTSDVRQPASYDIVQMAESIAGRSQLMADKLESKLIPVMSPQPPNVKDSTTHVSRDYPQLFDQLQTSLLIINRSLDAIGECIDRTEL